MADVKFFTAPAHDYMGRSFVECYSLVGRWQRIKWTLGGSPYVVHNGKRYHLDKFYRFGSAWCPGTPFEVTSKARKTAILCGYEMEEYYKPLFIELDTCGEYARLFRYEGSETK